MKELNLRDIYKNTPYTLLSYNNKTATTKVGKEYHQVDLRYRVVTHKAKDYPRWRHANLLGALL